MLKRLWPWPSSRFAEGASRGTGPGRMAAAATSLAGLGLLPALAQGAVRLSSLQVLAQETAEAPAGPSVLDWGIVVVLIGAALFAVGRTSRRS